MKQKIDMVHGLTSGIEGLFKKNKVDYIRGWASFKNSTTIDVSDNKEFKEIEATNFVIASGSSVISLPGITIDEINIFSSTGILSLDQVPESLLVVGGGVIGLELATVWAN